MTLPRLGLPLALVFMAAAAPAWGTGETSSWQSDIQAPGQVAKTAKPAPNVKTTPQPGAKKGAPADKSVPGGASTFTKAPITPGGMAPVGGDDAAYMAFDQGQYLTALRLATEAAKKNDPQAHTLIARIYAEGLGVPRNDAVAAQWYARGSELGDMEATFALGLMLAQGRGVAKNADAAAQLFETAARKGHALANYNLGLLFLSGSGKPENPYRAAQHIAYAAEKGIAPAQYDLAGLFQKGVGVQPDAYEAARWMRRAADQGMPEAQYEYGVMLLRGQGINADLPRTVELLSKAADRGIAGAQNRLAYIYAEGVGVMRNMREAAKWRLIAQSNGITEDPIDAVIAKMSRADRAAAEQMAQDWRDRGMLGLPN